MHSFNIYLYHSVQQKIYDKKITYKNFCTEALICKKYMEIVDLLTWCLEDKVSYCRLAPVVGEVTVE